MTDLAPDAIVDLQALGAEILECDESSSLRVQRWGLDLGGVHHEWVTVSDRVVDGAVGVNLGLRFIWMSDCLRRLVKSGVLQHAAPG